MNHICLDANVIVKLVVREPDSVLAHALWDGGLNDGVEAVAPVMAPFEIFSAIRRKTYRQFLSPVEARQACAVVARLPISYVHHDDLVWRSLDLAQEFDQPTIFDTLYLAVAEIYGCDFWTADEAFFHTVADKLTYVRLLADYQGSAPDA